MLLFGGAEPQETMWMSFQEVVYVPRAIKWFKAVVGTVRGLHYGDKMISFKKMAVAAVIFVGPRPLFLFFISFFPTYPGRVLSCMHFCHHYQLSEVTCIL